MNLKFLKKNSVRWKLQVGFNAVVGVLLFLLICGCL